MRAWVVLPLAVIEMVLPHIPSLYCFRGVSWRYSDIPGLTHDGIHSDSLGVLSVSNGGRFYCV